MEVVWERDIRNQVLSWDQEFVDDLSDLGGEIEESCHFCVMLCLLQDGYVDGGRCHGSMKNRILCIIPVSGLPFVLAV